MEKSLNSKLLQKMLERGFGLYSINSALSLKIHHDTITLCIAELPGVPYPVEFEIESRNIGGIAQEVFDHTTQFIFGYLETLQHDILNM